jgi:hypothetical protein
LRISKCWWLDPFQGKVAGCFGGAMLKLNLQQKYYSALASSSQYLKSTGSVPVFETLNCLVAT